MHVASLKLLFSYLILSLTARPYIIVLSEEDLKEYSAISCDESGQDWDEFVDFDSPHKSEDELDPGSWRSLFDPAFSSASGSPDTGTELELLYISAVSKMISAASSGDARLMQEAAAEIEAAACEGHPHSRSVLGFLHGMGMMRERNKAKAFLYHHFAADGGNMHSKMALAYSYSLQEMYENATKLYTELAEVAVNSLRVLKDFPVIAPVRIHNGAEKNMDVLRKSTGEDNEDIQMLEYQALQGNAGAMYKIGLFYYAGLRGLKRDHAKAIPWFLKAVEKGEPRSMELLGAIHARGVGVERNYTKALEWLTLASRQKLYSAYNGMGYMYVKGYGVTNKNYTKAKEYFEKAANNEDAGGLYNLGVMYLKGIAVKKDSSGASTYFIQAANAGHQKALFQLAKMFHTGVGLKKNLVMANALYKLVAEQGPWNSLSRWAFESYIKGDVGKAFLLYARMAELGYEVAQTNVAWILDNYGESSMCMGEFGFCTDAERHQLAHSLWWKASKQGYYHPAEQEDNSTCCQSPEICSTSPCKGYFERRNKGRF